uniref:Uncharacterized protein n=1 Tax=uncultured marine virus TaxID=186617 RepID=A0A0F7L554_9VIRU|nr:hypothetical protein [uncultured marine virus]
MGLSLVIPAARSLSGRCATVAFLAFRAFTMATTRHCFILSHTVMCSGELSVIIPSAADNFGFGPHRRHEYSLREFFRSLVAPHFGQFAMLSPKGFGPTSFV